MTSTRAKISSSSSRFPVICGKKSKRRIFKPSKGIEESLFARVWFAYPEIVVTFIREDFILSGVEEEEVIFDVVVVVRLR